MDTPLTDQPDDAAPDAEPGAEEELRAGMEHLFFAYRDFIAQPDRILTEYGFGRAHHRVIFFVGRYPGMAVRQLLEILQITKQSLSRVLSQLVREGYVERRQGETDRRQRRLYLTKRGTELERRLSEDQRQRFARAYGTAGPDAVRGFRTVLDLMISGPPKGGSGG